MKNLLILFLLLISLSISSNAQNNDVSKDDSKLLKLELLIKLADADLLTIDKDLTNNDYTLNESKPDADIISYKYLRYNFFFFSRFVTKKAIKFKFGFTDALNAKYIQEIADLKLKQKESALIENGIKTVYEDNSGKWTITYSKTKNLDSDQLIIEISIFPI